MASEGFTEGQLEKTNAKGRPEIYYRLDWVRTNLKRAGVLENPSRGRWTVTRQGRALTEPQCRNKFKEGRSLLTKDAKERRCTSNVSRRNRGGDEAANQLGMDPDTTDVWKDALLDCLKKMEPDGFERLAQRLLIESGFKNVAVTGKPSDGGIDGFGTYSVSLVSFRVYFQCKKYAGTVAASHVRDFRGALEGRGEKGLLITTGEFGPAAREEAMRDGATPIELIDGEALCDLLKEQGLGVIETTRTVEEINVDEQFFAEM